MEEKVRGVCPSVRPSAHRTSPPGKCVRLKQRATMGECVLACAFDLSCRTTSEGRQCTKRRAGLTAAVLAADSGERPSRAHPPPCRPPPPRTVRQALCLAGILLGGSRTPRGDGHHPRCHNNHFHLRQVCILYVMGGSPSHRRSSFERWYLFLHLCPHT